MAKMAITYFDLVLTNIELGDGKTGIDVFNNKFEIIATRNSACVAIESIRCAKLAFNRGVGGVLLAPSACFCKHTLGRFTYDESFNMIEQFINDEENSCVHKLLV